MNPSRLLALAMLFSAAAGAQSFVLDIADGSNLTVPASRMIPVHVIYTGNDASVKGFRILASQFVPTDQDAVPVEILRNCDSKAGAENQPTAFDLQANGTASLCLRIIPELNSDGKYSGNLTLFTDNNKTEAPKRFSFSRAASPPATLATDRQSLIVELDRPISARFSTFDAPLGSVVLQEKSAKGAARGVAVQIDSALKTPGSFDPLTGLEFQWEGKCWDKPFSTFPMGADGKPNPRIIDPSHQVTIAVTGKNLQPGE
jgi:hypothetical protein